MGVKHVELIAATAGFTTLTVPGGADYGFDLPLFTFDARGVPQNGYVFLQVRSSKRLEPSKDRTVSVRIKSKHLRHWLAEPMPVILVRYDQCRRKAYWLYVQRYFARRKTFSPSRIGRSLALRIPTHQVVTVASMKRFAEFKNRVIIQAAQVIDHA